MSRAHKSFEGDNDDEEPRERTSKRDKDADFDRDAADNLNEVYIDKDDVDIAGFGQPASAADTRVVTVLVKRFYEAAKAGDGRAACRLLYSLYRESVAEDYGGPTGLPYAHGKTCAVVLSKDFKHNHRLTLAAFHVTAVRVKGNYGYALLGSKTWPASYFNIQRERGSWKLVGLLASTLS